MEVKNLKEQIENLVKDELKLSNLVSNYSITIGIIKGKNKVRKTSNSKTITNADILYILENGSKLQNIPPRPVLDMTLQYAKYDKLEERIVDTVIDGVVNKGWTDSNVENYIKMEAQELVNYTRDLINSNE